MHGRMQQSVLLILQVMPPAKGFFQRHRLYSIAALRQPATIDRDTFWNFLGNARQHLTNETGTRSNEEKELIARPT